MTNIRILLVDDHPSIPGKVAEILKDVGQLVGAISNGLDAVEAAIRECPDVVVMDISMPIMNGIEAADRLIRMRAGAKILFLTVHEDPEFVSAALATGAVGYVIKSHMATDLLPAIHEV
ncbi:MAG: Two component transcriptional regulator, LuxR family, partial [Acidobacteria bacterium]|nr:Two component transcriptional regulator, LuxR family [Acidobacteriota bacterium]